MNKKFRIGYFADGIWAHEAMNKILDNSELELCFVCGRYETRDVILKQMAEDKDIEFLLAKDINSNIFLNKVKGYKCDLLVSMSFDQIFKKELIDLCPNKLINCHAGKLPFYRGRNVLNWVLINGEKEFGITVHYIDEGIDTGDIIIQETYPINDNDDYNSLLKIAYKECAVLLIEAIIKIKDNSVTLIKQESIHPVGFYCGIRKVGDEIIDWNQESQIIFNFIRAIAKPGPMARSCINGVEIKINKAELIENAPNYIGISGQIVGKDNNFLIIKTKDCTLKIIEYECDLRVNVGDRFV